MQGISSIFNFTHITLTQFVKRRKYPAVIIFIAVFAASVVLFTGAGPTNSEARWSAGWRAWKADDYEAALNEWSRCGVFSDFSIRPARVYYWRIRALDKLGRKKEAAVLKAEVARKFPFDYYAFLLFPNGGVSEYPAGTYGKIAEMLYPRPWSAEVCLASSKTGVSEELLWAVIRRESKFRLSATSSAGAVGLMQLMPSTAMETAARIQSDRTDADIRRPEWNILLGASYMEQLIKKFHGELPRVLAAYNAGASNVVKWNVLTARDWVEWVEEIPYAQTREYVRSVLENREVYRIIRGNTDIYGLMWQLTSSPLAPLAVSASADFRKEMKN